MRGNDAAMGGFLWDRNLEVFFAFNCDEFEFEDLSVAAGLAPRIHEMKNTIVIPDSALNLFIHTHAFGRALFRFEILGSLMKQPVLG